MKGLKKALSLVLATTLAVAMLSGCGAKSTSNTFKFGGIGPLTGGAAVYGIAAMNGAELAVKEINAAGGINGYQIEWQAQDDQHDATLSVNAYNSLKDWGMQVLIGTVTSGPCIAVADKSYADGMLTVTPSASSPEAAVNSNVFQVCFTDPNQGVGSADYIAAHFPSATVGIIYNSSEVYSTGIRDTFVKEAAAKGVNVVVEASFTSDSNKDFTTQLQQCKEAGVDLIFYPYYYTEASIILTEKAQMGYDATVFGVDGMDGIFGVEGFDVSLADGVYLLTPFAEDSTDPKTVEFVKNYKAAYGDTLNQFGADAYDAVYAVKAAMEAANCTPSMSAKEIGDVAIKAMTTITFDGLTGVGMTWNESGEVNKDPMAVIIKDGAYVSVAD